MAEHEEQQREATKEEQRKEKIANKQNEAKQTINEHSLNIKNLADSITALMEKEDFLEEDLDRSFELADEIQEQYEEIIALLFDIRDRLTFLS